MKWTNRIIAAMVILAVVGIIRSMLPPREVSRMLEQLSPPLAKPIGELCYAEGWSEEDNWYRTMEKQNGAAMMEDALLALAFVPDSEIAACAITILARKGDSRAAVVFSKIAADSLSPVRENAHSALEKMKARGIRSEGLVGKGEKGIEKERAP